MRGADSFVDNPHSHFASLYQTRFRGYKTFFMLNSADHKILIAHNSSNILKLKV